MEDYPFIRDLKPPVTKEQLRPLDPRCKVVQFNAPLSEDEFIKLAHFLSDYPDIPLRMYGHYRGADDLSFLRHFPYLKGFQVDVYEITSWSGLEFLPDTLEFLGLVFRSVS